MANKGGNHIGFLRRLSEREMIERDPRKVKRRTKAARLPVVKRLDSFDFTAVPQLTRCRCWIAARENVIALGPSGTGETHVALALALAACRKSLSAGFTTGTA